MAKQPTATGSRTDERGSGWGVGGAAAGLTNASPAAPLMTLHSSTSLAVAAVFIVMLAAATLPGSAEAYVLRGCYGQTEPGHFDGGSCKYGWEVDACGRHVRDL